MSYEGEENIKTVMTKFRGFGLPIEVIAGALELSVTTVEKNLPKGDRGIVIKSKNERRLKMLTLYAQLIFDEKACLGSIGVASAYKLGESLFRHLSLNEWEDFLEAVRVYRNASEPCQYEREVTLVQRKLIELIYPLPKALVESGKAGVNKVIKMMYESSSFPDKKDINNVEACLMPYIKKMIPYWETGRIFDVRFVQQLMDGISHVLSEKEQEVLFIDAGLVEGSLKQIAEVEDVSVQFLRGQISRAVKKIRNYLSALDFEGGKETRRKISPPDAKTSDYFDTVLSWRALKKQTDMQSEHIKNLERRIQTFALNLIEAVGAGFNIDPEVEDALVDYHHVDGIPIQLRVSISVLKLSTRAFNATAGLLKTKELYELVQYTEAEFSKPRNIGPGIFREVKFALEKRGLHFGMVFER